MSTASQFPFFIGLLSSGAVCGAWWYAALRKRKVAIFYWLAAGHTLSFGIQTLRVGYVLTNAGSDRWASVASMQTIVAVVLAGLYVALVRWLVDQPDQP